MLGSVLSSGTSGIPITYFGIGGKCLYSGDHLKPFKKKSLQLLKFTKADMKHWSIYKKLLDVFLCSQKQSNLKTCDMLNTGGQSH